MQLLKETCPLDGEECRAENVIYQATIKTDNSSKIYIWLSANQLKKTYINTQCNNKNQIKLKKLPPVKTSNWTFKINPQIKKWKQELQKKIGK